MGKLIPLAEARVRSIRPLDPALAEKAASLKGVLEAKDVLLQEPPSEPDPVVRRAQGHARALANTKLLEAFDDAVRAYRIRLWGTLDRSKPAMWLDELEQQIGKLDIFESTLTCDGRVWLDLRCDEEDIYRAWLELRCDEDDQSETPPLPAAQPDEAVSERPTASRRRRNQGGGTQTLRARAVLNRMHPEGVSPGLNLP
jgi:hypothetical protein